MLAIGVHSLGCLLSSCLSNFHSGRMTMKFLSRILRPSTSSKKKRFDDDAIFKERAQKAVVSLQGGEPKYRKAWAQICEISRREFQKVYKRLGVHIEEKGESFYNPYISTVLEGLSNQGLIKESEGGFNYASTDLTALWYRLNEEKAEWIIYVTDVGQREHFEMFFLAGKKAGWLPLNDNAYPKVTHVGFGLVMGNDGKRFRTRSSEVVRLVDLLHKAKNRSKQKLIERGKAEEWTEEELDQTAEAVGYGAVKFADLVNNRLSNYTFSFDHMVNDQGKTAVYLLYAHARICSIIRKSGKDIEELKGGELVMDHADERALGVWYFICFDFLRLSKRLVAICCLVYCATTCTIYHIFTLSSIITKLNGSAEETSRLLLCEAAAVVMRKCFELLGITPVYKI